MQNTPIPNKRVKGAVRNNVISILTNLSDEQKELFAQRVNNASDKRILTDRTLNNNTSNLPLKDWQYWFFTASLSEIFGKLLLKAIA